MMDFSEILLLSYEASFAQKLFMCYINENQCFCIALKSFKRLQKVKRKACFFDNKMWTTGINKICYQF